MNSVDVSPSSGFSHIYDSMNNSLSNESFSVSSFNYDNNFLFIVFSYLGYNISYPQKNLRV